MVNILQGDEGGTGEYGRTQAELFIKSLPKELKEKGVKEFSNKEIREFIKRENKRVRKGKGVYSKLKERLSYRSSKRKVPRAKVRINIQRPLSPVQQQKSIFFRY